MVGILGSIPGVAVGLGVVAVLVLLKFAVFVFTKDASKTKHNKFKEAPMIKFHQFVCAFGETAWTLGTLVTAGLLLLPWADKHENHLAMP